jgi:hypothetical protein
MIGRTGETATASQDFLRTGWKREAPMLEPGEEPSRRARARGMEKVLRVPHGTRGTPAEAAREGVRHGTHGRTAAGVMLREHRRAADTSSEGSSAVRGA